MPRALIVGHSGQDGRLLWQRLAGQGFQLAGVSRRETIGIEGEALQPVDLADPTALVRLVEATAPDHVYYLAAYHRSSQDAPVAAVEWENSWRVHVHGFQNLLEAIAECRPGASVFYASSSRIFGAGGGLRDEASPRLPECPYGVTKASGMLVAARYRTARSIRVSSGILFNHESPLRGSSYLSQRVVKGLVAVKLGRADRLVVGDLAALVDWGYAPDYVRAMQLMVECDAPGDYVVATGVLHSVRDFVAAAARRLDLDWRQCVEQSPALLTRVAQGLRGDATRLREKTAWQPSISFDDMVGALVDHALAEASAR